MAAAAGEAGVAGAAASHEPARVEGGDDGAAAASPDAAAASAPAAAVATGGSANLAEMAMRKISADRTTKQPAQGEGRGGGGHRLL